MINPSFDKERQKEKCFQYLVEASGTFRTRLRMLCPASLELDEALLHVAQAVVCAKKAIEAALDTGDE